jgi:hypothetical protein
MTEHEYVQEIKCSNSIGGNHSASHLSTSPPALIVGVAVGTKTVVSVEEIWAVTTAATSETELAADDDFASGTEHVLEIEEGVMEDAGASMEVVFSEADETAATDNDDEIVSGTVVPAANGHTTDKVAVGVATELPSAASASESPLLEAGLGLWKQHLQSHLPCNTNSSVHSRSIPTFLSISVYLKWLLRIPASKKPQTTD